jgi:biopolymer transport protein ExbD
MAMGNVPGQEGGDEGGGIFADINITPLTDIFLVLLIIFMVTASASQEANQGGIKITLPQGGAADPAKQDEPLDIFIVKPDAPEQQPRILIEGKDLNNAELQARLKAEVAKNPQVVVRVRADENVIHKYVAGILELVRESGVAKLSIATQVRSQ